MKLVLGVAISALLLVSIVGFDDSWALKSHGIKQTKILSDNVCGLDLCSATQNAEQKITNYLGDLEKSSIEVVDYEDLDKNIAHITKTSIVSKDFLLVHYSDGNWELIDRYGFAEGLLRSQSQSGDSQMEFGGTLDSDVKDNVGQLLVSQPEMTRPLSNAIKEIKIYGNLGEKSFPNVLLKIDFPERPSQNFVISVDNSGNFEATLNIDKNTPVGIYSISATYASILVGTTSFTINEQIILALAASTKDEKTNSITLSTDVITIPTSYAQVQIIQVSGTLADYHRGNVVELILISENGKEYPRKITASRDGIFFTFFNITPEFPEGVSNIIVKYQGSEVARTSLSAYLPIFTLR